MKTTWIACCLVAACVTTAVRAADRDEIAPDLRGKYTIVRGEKFGDKIPAEHFLGAQVQITDRDIIVTDRDDKQTYVAKYKLDTRRRPWRISMVSTLPANGQPGEGIVEIGDDECVKLIYAISDGELPHDFKTKDKQLLFELRPGNSLPDAPE